MSATRKTVAITVLLAVAIVAAGWFLLISPKHADAADLQSRADKETSAQAALRQQIAMLTSDEKHAATYQAALAVLKQRMPEDTAQPALIREIYKAADAANVSLGDVTPGTPAAPLNVAPLALPTPSTTGAAGGASPTPSATASAAPAPLAVGLAGAPMSVIPVAITVTGTYVGIEDFLSRTQQFRRAFLVSGVNLAIADVSAVSANGPATSASATAAPVNSYSGLLKASITGSVFSSSPPGEVGTVVATPSASPTQTRAVTPAPHPTTSARRTK